MAEKKKFQAIKGTRDLLPAETELGKRVEQRACEVVGKFGFGEIRPPIFEPKELFARAVGGETDIVSKEMYTFDASAEFLARFREIGKIRRDTEQMGTLADMNTEELISLRPEATASVCRAYIEHGMHALPQPVKLYYTGPMFRRERPQKGRYRQFYQIGAEVLEAIQRGQGGAKDIAKDAATDAEVIEMVMEFFRRPRPEGAEVVDKS